MLEKTVRAEEAVHARIEEIRSLLGEKLAIVGHHYQGDDIIRHVDKAGDSLQLAQLMGSCAAEHVVFCGVHFMAESACLLARSGQKVYLPDLTAGCAMADMVPAERLDAVLTRLTENGRKVVPLAYVNTSLAVKAVVGKFGGAVCTSSNAPKMLKWAVGQGEAVLFVPDMNLGRNTAKQIGIPASEQLIIDPYALDLEAASKARLLLWPGYCPIHQQILPSHIEAARAAHPGAKIFAHPECRPEVIDLCDGFGSTSFLIKAAAACPEGDAAVIGTESHLVRRLTEKHRGRADIVPLADVACEDMAKITPQKLLDTLEGILAGTAEPVHADTSLFADGRASLTRMLENC